MSVINNGILLGAGADAATTYQISRSLRFNSDDSAYLNWTPGSAGNRKTWTWAGWVKRSALSASTRYGLFAAANASGTSYTAIEFYNDAIRLLDTNSGGTTEARITSAIYRDPSAWMHIALAYDTTQATPSNRIKLYANGSEVTQFSTSSNPSQNSDAYLNQAVPHTLGSINTAGTPSLYFSGYLADIHFIDGSALDPTSFTETDATTGQLIPKAFTGSYGTNGFRLTFSDNSGTTATTLGKDAAGSNNWTPNNFSVASGAGNDSLVDSPTGYGTDTGAGGEVRGNYATINPLQNAGGDTFSNGNLQVASSASNYGTHTSTIATPLSGKWYAEVTIGSASSYSAVGLVSASSNFTTTSWTGSLNGVAYYGNNGNKYVDASSSSYGASFGNGDVIGIAYDADNGTVAFYKNGTSQGTISSVTVRSYYFGGSDFDTGSSVTYNWNFGQRDFAYTAPSGYKALCSHNLPEPTILKGNTAMDAVTYSGNNSTQTISLNFNPDFIWLKCRNFGRSHRLIDTVRGIAYQLFSNSTDGGSTYDATSYASSVSAVSSSGFELTNSGSDQYNTSGETYVAWAWDMGSSTVTNTSGTISSQVRASATNGCSVVTYTGTGSNATVGHGLGVAPSMIIVKNRNGTFAWRVYHASLANTQVLYLSATDAATTETTAWNSTSPTSSVFSLGTGNGVNGSSNTYVAYCFAPVAGFSAFGSYSGTGSDVFVYTGFRPRWVMIKYSSGSASGITGWGIWDATRGPYNVNDPFLEANLSDAEATSAFRKMDFVSNGFVLKGSGVSVSGNTYIYAAFAEAPFKYSRAR